MEPLASRRRRYWRVVKLTSPPPDGKGLSLQEAADALPGSLSRERVRQILAKGEPKPNGRPTGSLRRPREVGRLASLWRERAAKRRAAGLDPSYAESRADALEQELAAIGGPNESREETRP